jgi:hypothetical protein
MNPSSWWISEMYKKLKVWIPGKICQWKCTGTAAINIKSPSDIYMHLCVHSKLYGRVKTMDMSCKSLKVTDSDISFSA